jgi:hypothetical protein
MKKGRRWPPLRKGDKLIYLVDRPKLLEFYSDVLCDRGYILRTFSEAEEALRAVV